MLSASFEYRSLIAQNSKVLVRADLTFADGEVRALSGDDVMQEGLSISDAVSSTSSFDVGAAVINQCELTLNNYEGKFDECDFTGAVIVPYVGVELSDGTTEWLRKGVYTVEQPDSYGGVLSITAYDNMSLFEKDYAEVDTSYPATLRTIVMDVCDACGVTLGNPDFDNCSFVVPERPDDSSLTCLDVLSYAAQASGNWARCDEWGYVRLSWYDTSAFEGEDWLDGETFDDASPYASGDDADGGDFDDYSSGDSADGGSFGNAAWHVIHAHSSLTVLTDDVVITGVRVTAQDGEDSDGEALEGETELCGAEGYVLEISDNPLIQYGDAAEVAEQVGERVVGMRFRPFESSSLGTPVAEAGDPAIVIDRKQNQYRTYLTSVTYKAGNYETYACNAETASRNSASSYSALTKAAVALRNSVKQEQTARERAIANLATELAESSGLFMTEEEQDDGSTIYYMHDKPTLAESQIVWKLTANAFGISTDGGQTYPYGLDVNGDAILNRIYAIGLDASYITTGALVVGDGSDAMFSADIDTGQVSISGDCVTIGSRSLTDEIDGIKAVYGTCTTAAATQEKAVTCSGFELSTGSVVNVRFTRANTASSPTLNVNSTGAKEIYVSGATITEDFYWGAYDVVTFVYNGSKWCVADSGTLSKIKTTADSIVLSVSQTYATQSSLESAVSDAASTYATKSELTVGLESIELSVSQTYATQSSLESAVSDIEDLGDSVSTLTLTASSLQTSVASLQASWATCTTASATAAKVASCSGFVLATGSVVCVKFSNKNTASSPTLNVNSTGAKAIWYGSAAITSDNYWAAGAVVTFVYSGSYWYVSDAGSLSAITQLADSISLSVSTSGSTASITLSVDGESVETDFATRTAFANDTTSITISAGTITFDSNTFVVNSSYFTVSKTGVISATSGSIASWTLSSSALYNDYMYIGQNYISMYEGGERTTSNRRIQISTTKMNYYYEGTMLGGVGSNHFTDNSSYTGITFDLEYSGYYMSWARKKSSSADEYTIGFMYANKTFTVNSTSYSSDHFYFTSPVCFRTNTDFADYLLYNAWIEPNSGGANGGITGTLNFTCITNSTSTGWTYSNGCSMTFQNGMLTAATWPS